MQIHDDLLCLFNSEAETRDGSTVIEVPEREVELGTVREGSTYRVALLPSATESETEAEGTQERDQGRVGPPDADPPVGEGDTVEVEIEDIGEQGDGIARVGPGYVVIVSGTDLGDRVTVEIEEAQSNVAFADVVDGPY